MPEPRYRVLFLCTGNSARSILAEATLRHLGEPRFVACSAGSKPKGTVDPTARDLLERLGISTQGLRSKSWDEFAGSAAPKLDFIFTVCDSAAGESCPIWPGTPITALWAVPDPAAVDASPLARTNAFRDAFRMLERRIQLFINLPIASLDTLTLSARVREIGTR
jgi:arsenate reductase